MSELAESLTSRQTVFILRDLESLPSPPDDPVPILLRDLTHDLAAKFKDRGRDVADIARLSASPTISEFKRAFQATLRELDKDCTTVVLMLDEIEYLTPSDRIDIREGDMTSISQFPGDAAQPGAGEPKLHLPAVWFDERNYRERQTVRQTESIILVGEGELPHPVRTARG